jgi:hypothetical protein
VYAVPTSHMNGWIDGRDWVRACPKTCFCSSFSFYPLESTRLSTLTARRHPCPQNLEPEWDQAWCYRS